MRITLPKFDTSNPEVRALLEKARNARTLAEAACYQRDACKLS